MPDYKNGVRMEKVRSVVKRRGVVVRARAFTLVEILVAMSLMLLGILSVSAITSYSANVARQAETRSLALMIGRQTMEQVVSVSQGNRRSVTDEPIEISADLLAQFSGKSKATNVEATYSIRPVSGSKNLQNILVNIRWVNATSVNKDLKQSSISLIQTVSSVQNMETTPYDGWNPRGIDQYFYTPPPPPPPAPPKTNTGGSSSSTPGGSTTKPSTPSGNSGNAGSGSSGTPASSNGGGTSNTQNNTTTTWSPGNYGSKWQ